MLKLQKAILYDRLSRYEDQAIIVSITGKDAAPVAATTASTVKSAREACDALNRMNRHGYPRYVAVNRDVCWFE